MTDELSDMTDETAEEMTEQIEASFGPMTVYVSGTDSEDVQETFDDVWETMMDTSETMREMKQDTNSDEDGGAGPGQAFGD
jgi:predicted AlkP superfamily phosphohydrolase/phosphomutase